MAKKATAAAALATSASLTEAIVKAPAQTTVGGYQITLTAFIPVAPDDLKKQAAIPTILLAIQEGEKSFADLSEYLKQVEFRAPFTRKRMPETEAKALLGILDEPSLDDEVTTDEPEEAEDRVSTDPDVNEPEEDETVSDPYGEE